MIVTPWWKFIVLRGEGLPVKYDGRWESVEDLIKHGSISLRNFGYEGMIFEATNQWEQRDDGQVAVVFRYIPRSKRGISDENSYDKSKPSSDGSSRMVGRSGKCSKV